MNMPIQPIVNHRFVSNKLVDACLSELKKHGFTLNDLAELPDIPREHWVQFAQLIGYSIDGFSTLSYVQNADLERVDASQEKNPDKAEIKQLRADLSRLKRQLRKPIADLFEIHPDDLGDA